MSSQIVSEDQRTAKLKIEIPAEEFQKSLQKAYRKNAKHFQVPGFRKGKVPYQLAVRSYGESILYDDALEDCVPKAYEAALEENDLKVYSDPRFNVTEIGGDVGLTLEVDVALKPEVELGAYEGVEAYRPAVDVEDAQIDAKIEEAREGIARMVTITDRPIENGDFVTIDYQGLKDDVPFEGGTAEGYRLEIGSGSFIPGFEEGLIGHELDEDVELPLTFPESYHADELAGADVIFRVKIHEIQAKELPDLDDEFVRDVSETSDTMDEYREEIRRELAEQQEAAADREFEQNIVRKIADDSTIEMSDLMVEDEVDRMVEQQSRQFAMYGLNFNDFLQYSGQTLAEFREHQADQARQMIKEAWCVETIREKEGDRFELTDEEFDEAVEDVAGKYGVSTDVFKDQYLKSEHDREHFRHDRETAKLLDWLRDVSVATDVMPEPEAHEHDEDCDCDHDHDEDCDCGHDHDGDGHEAE